ncbi:MAG: ABC transporter substrate-binding protein [bacterium]
MIHRARFRRALLAPLAMALAAMASPSIAQTYIEPPYLAARVAAGALPPTAQRLPTTPSVVEFDARSESESENENERTRIGEYGGTLRLLMGKSKDIRMMMVYGYARLIGYDRDLNLAADILARYEAKEQRQFTFHLRRGHRWSDGAPFTAEAFRYYWNDIVNNEDLYPFGLPKQLLVDGEAPRVEFIDAATVRYTWSKANPHFLPALAAPRPLFLYAPGHYLKQFHADHAAPDRLAAMVADAGARNWAGLHHRKNHPYKNDNPELPVLQPWVNSTAPPAERFVFKRNPYYHRVDTQGRQLPYLDEVAIHIASSSLVAAKTAAGESDLQGRYIRLDNYTFLKAGESRNDFSVRLWRGGGGSQLALYPNLNHNDPTWRDLARDRRFRRALSLGINRFEINQVIYFGLANESNNTVLPESPLFDADADADADARDEWIRYDLAAANRLLDDIGLTERSENGLRRMRNGETLEIVLHTAGESTEETDILELIGDSWRKLGIKLHTKPSQREVFRERVFSGEAMMAMWGGIDNGLPTAGMSPQEFAPTSQTQLQWPKWGQYFESSRKVGEPPDLAAAAELLDLYQRWSNAPTALLRETIWRRMLAIHREEVFTIGLINGVPQPIVVSNRLRNVPQTATWGWLPTAYFGVHRPDTFWLSR